MMEPTLQHGPPPELLQEGLSVWEMILEVWQLIYSIFAVVGIPLEWIT